MAKRNHNSGMFKRGPDPRRHQLTTEERQRGFWAAIDSIITRHPDCLDTYGRHMAVKFLKKRRKAR